MPSFELELDLSVEVGPMWAVMETQNNLLPKLLPEIYQSIDIVEGEGAPGSVRLVMFGSMVPNGGYVQEVIRSKDRQTLTVVSEEVSGGHLETYGFTKWVQTFKLIPAEEGSKLLISAEFEGGSEEDIDESNKWTKLVLIKTFEVLERCAARSS